MILLPMGSEIAGITGEHHHAQLIEMGVSLTFSGLVWNLDHSDLHLPHSWDYR
jgi:hypothetical protein